MGNHVFICYAREDREFVVKFATHLKGRGVPVWVDLWDIQPSQDWDKTIDDAIYECAKFLIVLSPAAVASQEVRGELHTALGEGKPITPVIYQSCRIPRQLRTVQYVDFTARGAEDVAALDQVVRVLGGEQPSPPSAPRPPDISPSPQREKRGWLSWFSLPRIRMALLLSVSFAAVLFAMAYLFSRQDKETLDLPSTTPPPSTPSQMEVQPSPPPQVEEKPSASKTTPSTTEAPPSKTEKKPSDSEAMISIPSGEFWMGCNEKVDTQCESDEKPGRTVYLDAYSIDKYEVTVVEYRRCLEASECSIEGLTESSSCNWNRPDRANHPVNCANWAQAQVYCQWAGKRLPTEAEWEKAARGTKRYLYPWGNEWDMSKANSGESKKNGTAAVGSYPSGVSPYEVHDMAGRKRVGMGARLVRGGLLQKWS